MDAETIRQAFYRRFGEEPLLVRSPGRVNLLGEHTDYNLGLVLPAAIDKCIWFALGGRDDRRIWFYAENFEQSYECRLDDLSAIPGNRWAKYLLGVVSLMKRRGFSMGGFNVLFGGNIPVGAGLSSSAALECGLAFALNELFQLKMEKLGLIELCRQAENDFVGVPCGIMDQFANMLGAKNKVIRLDCRSLAHRYYPFNRPDIRIVLCDTGVRRSLSASEYQMRREQCEQGVRILRKAGEQISSLREVSLKMLHAHRTLFPPVILRRCEYVVRENARVNAASFDLESGNFPAFGRKMFETHRGLRDDFAVSCPELDLLVALAEKQDGVLGARMMGAGFGGCTINLVEQDSLENFRKKIRNAYRARTGKTTKIWDVRLERGTSRID